MTQSKKIYAFIDSQNLNLGVKSLGWKLDFKKFRIYLKDKYRVERAYLFLGYIEENVSLYKKLRRYGYILIFKPVVKYRKDSKYKIKGNIDVELVLTVVTRINRFDKAVLVSGDGDFFSLIRYLVSKKKLSKIIVPNSKYSTLLRMYTEYIINLQYLKSKLGKE